MDVLEKQVTVAVGLCSLLGAVAWFSFLLETCVQRKQRRSLIGNEVLLRSFVFQCLSVVLTLFACLVIRRLGSSFAQDRLPVAWFIMRVNALLTFCSVVLYAQSTRW